jgi:nucleoside 2-deoxyribosyltransferase
MIYLASPYSHDDPAVRRIRYEQACQVTAALMRKGKHVFSPIAHSHGVALFGVPGDWEYWMSFDRWFIERCDEVRVLMLDGYRKSKGVQAEIEIAEELGKFTSWVTLEECLQ